MNNLLHSPILDASLVQSFIPQKAPFVMVDKLFYYSEEKVESGLTIQENLYFLNNNLFEAPGLIENMAQTVALYTGYGYYLKNETPPEGYIGAISKVVINELPKLGDEIVTAVKILHDIMGITLVEAQVLKNNNPLASCRMKTALANK